MGAKQRRINVICVILCLIIFVATIPVRAESKNDQIDGLDGFVNTAENYRSYYESIADFPAAGQTITIEAAEYNQNSGGTVERLSDYKGEKNVLAIADKQDSLTYAVEVPEPGRYQVALTYYPLKSDERPIELGLMVDGEYPFDGAEKFCLKRVYQNETAILKDNSGNEYSPRQVEYFNWFTEYLKIIDGTVDDPVELYLPAGKHNITILTISQPYVLKSIILTPPKKVAGYQEYLAQQEDKGGSSFIKIEAELANRKSDLSLRPASDRSNPLTSPYHPSKVRMNILSSSWDTPGQWLEWDFDAPADGYYYFGVRYQQFSNINFFVTRKLFVDGELPFAEAANLRFDYCIDWRYTILQTGMKEPIKIYLTKGSHTIRLEAVLGDYEILLDNLNRTVSQLNNLYRQIIMITGVSPDKYQDYNLDKEIPELINILHQSAETLKSEYENIKKITGTNGTQASILNIFANQLSSFIKKPETIPFRISEFKNNIGSLAAWILDLRKQPVELDYIYLSQADAPQPPEKAGFIDILVHEIRSFIASFSEDYNSMGSSGKENGIDVWVSSGRDQAQIIRLMINDLFTPRYNINVNLKLVNAGMVEAFLSGRSPDVALSIGRGQPLNLAVRGALADLTQFDDFAKVKEWFLPTALDPYFFENGCFGLPDTQNFYMMFYRTDIFRELGLTIPNTWDELYLVIPEIHRHNMEVGIPYTTIDAFGAADAGMGVRNIFPALLLQRGGSFYNSDKSMTNLGTDVAVDAFRQWCRMYKEYGLQLSYDFFNRFRTGEMPLAIATYTEFARLESAAPEISGLWDMVPIPGVIEKDGTINRAQAGSGTACVITSKTKKLDDAWTFLKWYCSAEAQTRFAKDVEAQMGVIARVALANTEALESLSWKSGQLKNIAQQRQYVQEIPEVLGGYYLIRGLDNAFREVVYEGKNSKESLMIYNKKINEEISRKRKEFGLG